ncbi:MAG: acyl-CoA dehydrogenase family protein [Frankiaceae bacterium]|jgi:alkylation response protein AidB-like acyl-CoA dehydrogenase|nr:acyl-CoA dehydrogenase family protein [Frankiaceae bacterium]
MTAAAGEHATYDHEMSDEELRAEVDTWLLEYWDPDMDSRQWLDLVIQSRWAVPRWPVRWHGRGLSDHQGRIVEAAFHDVGAPGSGQDRKNLWANTALAFGTDTFKEKFIPALLRQELSMCLLYSEPGAGSDLAGVRTRAERDGDQWIVNGQKVWTSGAATADYGMLIARTDWDVPKHRGLSFFFCPMKQPGVEVRPLRQITDESQFNQVFITDATIPGENLLGEPNDGWRVLQTALAYERSVMGEGARGPRTGGGYEVDLVALAREAGVLSDPVIRQQIASATALRTLNALNTARAKAELAQGTSSPIMSLGKLAMSRILHEGARVQTAILAAQSLLEGPDHPRAEDANFLTLNAYFTSIGGGTDQIQRNIIAERVLGLPKEPEVDREIPFRQVRASG